MNDHMVSERPRRVTPLGLRALQILVWGPGGTQFYFLPVVSRRLLWLLKLNSLSFISLNGKQFIAVNPWLRRNKCNGWLHISVFDIFEFFHVIEKQSSPTEGIKYCWNSSYTIPYNVWHLFSQLTNNIRKY